MQLKAQRALPYVMLTGVLAAGTALAAWFYQGQGDSHMTQWQERLSVVADSRQQAVDDWFATQQNTLRSLAHNTALQLYMADLAAGNANSLAGQAQAGYLRNLLAAVADQAGFNVPTDNLPANVTPPAGGGLALVTETGRLLVASPQFPASSGVVKNFIAGLQDGQSTVGDVFLLNNQQPTLLFAEPAFALQSDTLESSQSGWVIGVKPLRDDFFRTLRQPGDPYHTSETYLVRQNQGMVEYLTPLADGSAPLQKRLAANADALLANQAIANPGLLLNGLDYATHHALAVSRKLTSTPWTLVRKINEDEALGALEQQARLEAGLTLAATLALLAAMIAVWRQGSNRRLNEALQLQLDLTERHQRQERLLSAIANTQPNALVLLDADGHVIFANEHFAAQLKQTAENLIGKDLPSLLGPAAAEDLVKHNQKAVANGSPALLVRHEKAKGRGDIYTKSQHIPVPREDGSIGVLMVMTDITKPLQAQESRNKTLNELVETIVALVDRRDPDAAHHSKRVAELAGAIAQQLELSADMEEAAAMAGRLVNIGKLFIQEDLLRKREKLTKKEMAQIRKAMYEGTDMLKDIPFSGPVVETLRQAFAHWDGTGEPRNLKGENILITARIVSAANTYTALTSPRAWRKGLPARTAIDQMLAQSDKVFDRAVVLGLANLVENKGRSRKSASA